MSVARNTVWNITGALFPTLVSLAILPLFLDRIGLERYGVLSIAFVILGYFGLFDLGLGRATAQKIATLKDAAPEARSEVLWTSVIVNAGFAVVGAVVIAPLAVLYFDRFMPLESGLAQEATGAAIWLSLALPVALLTGVFTGALQGRERFAALNIVNMISTLALQLLPFLAAVLVSPSLNAVLPAAVLARVLAALMLAALCWRTVPMHRPTLPRRALLKDLLGFGGWVTVTALVGPILDVADRLIVGVLSGAAAVTAYTVPMTLLRRSGILSRALSNALFPRFAGISDPARQAALLRRAVAVLAAVLTPGFILVGFVLHDFMAWWIDEAFAAVAAPIGLALLGGMWANCLAQLPFAQLQAQGRPDLVAKCHLAELPAYLAALAALILQFGALGAALAWSARSIVDVLALFYLSLRSHRVEGLGLVVPAILLGLSVAAVGFLPLQGWLRWLVGAVLVLISVVHARSTLPADIRARLSLNALGRAKI